MKKSYTVVEKDDRKAFEEAVTDLLNQGWVPVGGMQFVRSPQNYVSFYQAMMTTDAPTVECS